ncbi:lipoyl(octanoyl) transferase LipB [Boudabousia marimammalium]|uniref:Octanoyltransferase n=1 Tax=Boudabousia marimammalium TaxID=156892 RepID=A0A1Q5PSS8_9ACTO|nr:lipoyl(octanoyl) transferase LipB [Boudabousia marimammalium]OKL50593.1 lipoyl(octanoyl) transferase [Boudabousia marimammalium]
MRILNLLPKGPQPYQEILDLQHQLHEEVRLGNAPDTFIVLEHEDTYTAGRRTQPGDVVNPNIPVVEADRGGRITYHGPGQLVVYPIMQVQPPVDVVRYVRLLEAGIIDALETLTDLPVTTVEGRSGVWLLREPDSSDPRKRLDRKICAIGVKFANDTTMHGLALNVKTNLDRFDEIVPCGIADATVTSLQAEGVDMDLITVGRELIPNLVESLIDLRYPDRIFSLTEERP